MYYEHLKRRAASIDSTLGNYYPPDDPRSKFEDENGYLHVLCPGALTPRGRRVGAEFTEIVIDIPRKRLPD